MNHRLAEAKTQRSRAQREWFWTLWAMFAAFVAYFCMYAFRKPFTAAPFAGESFGGLDYKTVLVTAQVFGYTLSKFLGIRVISEIPQQRRAIWILWLILLAELALLLFGMTSRPWNAICLFLNGLPLGMVFGMVLGLLEGRRMTEALTAGLCASFILADGVTKSVGAWLLVSGVSESWMPALAGALFFVPLALSVAMLIHLPPPTLADIQARSERSTMNRSERSAFVQRYFFGITLIVVVYFSVTILRSIRADFAPEIWKGLGSAAQPETFTQSELWVALGVLTVNGLMVMVKDNQRGFFGSLGVCAAGVTLILVTLVLHSARMVSPFVFMVMMGLGFYLPYVAIHTTVFERWLAMTRDRGTSSFLMYVVDSIGYLGYVVVMLGRQFLPRADDLLGLLLFTSWATVGVSAICLVLSWRYFGHLAATSASIHSSTAKTAGVAP